MLTRSILAITLSLASPFTVSALAQGAAETGTGGGRASTVTAPHTTSVGQTKPPGATAGPGQSNSHEARTEQMKKDEKIMNGICIGCGTK